MYEILLVCFLIVAIALVGLILIQHGKGADMGSSFGAGSSQTMFGSSGSGNFLTRSTAILATIFFVLSLVLGNLSSKQTKQTDEWADLEANATEQVEALVEDVPETTNKESDVPE
ncbi:preprotein translocase subunit SecG [Saccharobesus litoralis]|uniref:Protein-export membrane protein SecG n=1 Tax=Saccharobesus litoralis TaxID=2172099 RepID=A0A2S0VSK2_9ALTE|nr:preprotein translocase subunit SecG [Saccharobesus litoralis]AWB67080.1 preprotein translocase subunit SecG [Saccharobesus litoralis]